MVMNSTPTLDYNTDIIQAVSFIASVLQCPTVDDFCSYVELIAIEFHKVNAIDMLKQQFLRSLQKLSKGSSSALQGGELFRTTDEFLWNVFDFCRQGGPVSLTDTEKQEIDSQLSKALPTIKSGLHEAFLPLNADQRQTAKIYRSAVQFLVDDFGNLNVVENRTTMDSEPKRSPMALSEQLAELLKSGPVESLDEELVCWEDDSALGPFPYNPPRIDVAGVPSSHKWWNEDDRKFKK
uniref:Uncharacterized protein n=1 Tax=Plectus sambesii TaxID=2011161 RepID=A0A914X452_9BILA